MESDLFGCLTRYFLFSFEKLNINRTKAIAVIAISNKNDGCKTNEITQLE